MSLHAGDFIHIKGASGSGKSTLARCLTGLIPHLYHGKLSGTVHLCGMDTRKHPLWLLAESAGMVFQNPAAQMLGNTVEEEIIFGLENLGLSPQAIKQRLVTMIDAFHLEPFLNRAPQSLSGGEQQKLALAAIMARRPPILVLDEPFSMLDVKAASELLTLLIRLSEEGTTIIAFEHREEYFQNIPGILFQKLNGTERVIPVARPAKRQPPKFQAIEPDTCLQVKNLSVHLSGKTILDKLNFELHGGELTVIVGQNGSGKTTLLRTLAGLQHHDGTISIRGNTPNLGLVYQNADLQLFNPSVRDEILFRIPQPDETLYHSILEILGITRYENTPPLLLSEGEKKRVALASVLMRQPQHGLLMDEPSLGQDTRHKEMLVRLAHSLTQAGQIVVMTTHDLSLASQADRVILLNEHGIVAHGPAGEIFHNPGAWEQTGLFIPEWVEPPQEAAHV